MTTKNHTKTENTRNVVTVIDECFNSSTQLMLILVFKSCWVQFRV